MRLGNRQFPSAERKEESLVGAAGAAPFLWEQAAPVPDAASRCGKGLDESDGRWGRPSWCIGGKKFCRGYSTGSGGFRGRFFTFLKTATGTATRQIQNARMRIAWADSGTMSEWGPANETTTAPPRAPVARSDAADAARAEAVLILRSFSVAGGGGCEIFVGM